MSSNETTTTSSSSSGISSSDLNASDDPIYHIYKPEVITVNNGVREPITEKRKRLFFFNSQSSIEAVAPLTYVRHANLDTRKLTFSERLRLVRFHYFRKVRLFRIAFVACCVALFFITSTKVWEKFVNHVTVVNIEYKLPNVTTLPGITLCVHLSHGDKYEHVLVNQVLNESRYRTNKLPFIKLTDVVTKCQFIRSTVEYGPPDIYDCEQIMPVVVSIQYGHKCFTFFSDIYGDWNSIPEPQKRKYEFQFDLFPRIELSISDKLLPKSNSSKYQNLFRNMRQANNTLVYVLIHSAAMMPLMQETGTHFVVSQHTTNIWFQEQIEELMEAPYGSGCNDHYGFYRVPPPNLAFHKADLPNSKLLYRSHGECIMYCLWRRMNQECANFYSVFTSEMVNQIERSKTSKEVRFCPTSEGVAEYWTQMNACMERCPPPCQRRTFSVGRTYTEKSKNTKIIVEWRNEPVYVISHHAATSPESFIGNVGGHAHVWLGFSVVKLFNFLVNSIRTRQFIFGYCCLFHWFRWFRS